MPKGTTLRNVRVSDEVWFAAQERAVTLGYGSASGFVRAALEKLATHEKGTGRVLVMPPPRATVQG